jgi:hypothetical protein
MSFEAYLGAVVEAEAASGASRKALAEMIEEIIGIFKDPIILYPGGWEASLPPRLWERIRLERFVQQMKAKGKKIEESTDAEAMAYLYTVTLVGPIGDDWAKIYMWLGRDMLPEGVPRDEFVPKSLSSDQQRQLDDLKRWIYRKKTAGRKSIKPYPLEKASNKKKARKPQPVMGDLYGPEIIEAEY